MMPHHFSHSSPLFLSSSSFLRPIHNHLFASPSPPTVHTPLYPSSFLLPPGTPHSLSLPVPPPSPATINRGAGVFVGLSSLRHYSPRRKKYTHKYEASLHRSSLKNKAPVLTGRGEMGRRGWWWRWVVEREGKECGW